jgi:hypothetical protein
MVIVTNNQYILAKRIHHVSLSEDYNYHEIIVKGRRNTVRENVYSINIVYVPEDNGGSGSMIGNGREEVRECHVVIKTSKATAYKSYSNLIEQIRQQSPDQLFLDSALENILKQSEIEKIEAEEGKSKANEMWGLIDVVFKKTTSKPPKTIRKPKKRKR